MDTPPTNESTVDTPRNTMEAPWTLHESTIDPLPHDGGIMNTPHKHYEPITDSRRTHRRAMNTPRKHMDPSWKHHGPTMVRRRHRRHTTEAPWTRHRSTMDPPRTHDGSIMD